MRPHFGALGERNKPWLAITLAPVIPAEPVAVALHQCQGPAAAAMTVPACQRYPLLASRAPEASDTA